MVSPELTQYILVREIIGPRFSPRGDDFDHDPGG